MRQIDEFYEALGARIRLRRDKRLTQQELAHLVGLSRTSITNVERGRQRLMADQLLAVARALETTVDDLLPVINTLEGDRGSTVDKREMPTVARFVDKVFADTAA